MKVLIVIVLLSIGNTVLIDFKEDTSIKKWSIVNDTVMGGRSTSDFVINKDRLGIFFGSVSTKNNGGFAMAKYRFSKKLSGNWKKITIKLKGDGKQYQFRVKNNKSDYHSYVINFQTTGDWQTVSFNVNELYPSFRGRRLNMLDYQGDSLEEIAFLIGNKKDEEFKLIIENIVIQ